MSKAWIICSEDEKLMVSLCNMQEFKRGYGSDPQFIILEVDKHPLRKPHKFESLQFCNQVLHNYFRNVPILRKKEININA